MQVSYDKTYRKGWVSDLKQLLFSNGFAHVWLSQGVGNEELFSHCGGLILPNKPGVMK